VAVEIGLSDGTKLVLANRDAREDDVVDTVRDEPDGVMTIVTDDGSFRVVIRHVVFVRTID
jgi:hypothetical protein